MAHSRKNKADIADAKAYCQACAIVERQFRKLKERIPFIADKQLTL
jgi:hypothetical protein